MRRSQQNLKTIDAFDARKRGGRGALHARPGERRDCFLEHSAARRCGALDASRVCTAEQDGNHRCDRRIVKRSAKLNFRFVKRFVVMPQRVLNRVVRRKRGLDQHPPPPLPTPRPPGDLSEQVKSLLRGAEIGVAEDGVCAEDSGESYVWKVVAFAEHLRSDQRLRFAAAEAIENAHQRAFLARGIAIEDVDSDRRKIALESLLDLFGAEADRLKNFAAAQRALRWNRLS